jgi:hypothetical protein
MLAHSGITYEWVESVKQIGSGRFDILIVALASDNPETGAVLQQFADKGGAVIAFGGLQSMRLGCEEVGSWLRPSVYAFRCSAAPSFFAGGHLDTKFMKW